MQQPEDEPVVLYSRNEEELREKFRNEIHVSFRFYDNSSGTVCSTYEGLVRIEGRICDKDRI